MENMPERLHTIEINWGFPIPIENMQFNCKSTDIGIYYVKCHNQRIESIVER